jgi:hypothetical protein
VNITTLEVLLNLSGMKEKQGKNREKTEAFQVLNTRKQKKNALLYSLSALTQCVIHVAIARRTSKERLRGKSTVRQNAGCLLMLPGTTAQCLSLDAQSVKMFEKDKTENFKFVGTSAKRRRSVFSNFRKKQSQGRYQRS